ncbi:NUDIX domain-containing protein [Pseudochrobactrum asaccharolyticum]|uniref:NUDIX domain-containing protein n=1 Tax=Pseudochrobactrum asaccharolyticum TaxID=354351 RepID=A0A366DLJ2_9HYPH|nr:NUDIX domain-containing protein [Pseudochrobactrum asaccharolyticum]RBO90950.1 NUDIX domain-containing protein [Pseudochrobactrum asaccharolyticum]
MLPDNYITVFIDRMSDFIGVVSPQVAHILISENLVENTEKGLILPQRGQALEERLRHITQALYQYGHIGEYRGEAMAVMAHFEGEILAKIDRSALRAMGFLGVKVHINGIITNCEEPKIWLARRAENRRSAPLHLDTMVAGGQPYGKTLLETAIMEAWEEASLTSDQLQGLSEPDTIMAEYISPEGYHREKLVIYNLELPDSFKPACCDGEIIETFCVSKTQLQHLLTGYDRFKYNTELVCRRLLTKI